MPDLTPRQRQQLDEIADAFRTEYFRLSQRLVELRRQRDAGSPPMGIPSRDIIDREIELERLRFERDEVSARAKLRLRLVLTDEQLQRIPDLVR